MRVKAKSVNQNAEMTLPSKPSLNPIFKIKMAIYCPQGSGTLRQQLLSMHGIEWYCMVLHGIE